MAKQDEPSATDLAGAAGFLRRTLLAGRAGRDDLLLILHAIQTVYSAESALEVLTQLELDAVRSFVSLGAGRANEQAAAQAIEFRINGVPTDPTELDKWTRHYRHMFEELTVDSRKPNP